MTWIDHRDRLAFKKLQGVRLTVMERIALRIMNWRLGCVLPKPLCLPADVRNTIDEVLRRKGRREGEK